MGGLHYQVTLRKKIYNDLESLQKDLDEWLDYYNNERTHQGKMCCGRTPIDTLIDGKKSGRKRFLTTLNLTSLPEKPGTVRSSLSYYIV